MVSPSSSSLPGPPLHQVYHPHLNLSATAAVGSSTGGGTSSPCAACKFLRRKCQPDCVFAPYFPPDNQEKFVRVHRVFGASNVTKILNEIHPIHREDAVNSLAYEAEARLKDPVYGCLSTITALENRLAQIRYEAALVRNELLKFHSVMPQVNNSLININLQPAMMQQMMMMRAYDTAELAPRVGIGGGGGGRGDGGGSVGPYDCAAVMGMNMGGQVTSPLVPQIIQPNAASCSDHKGSGASQLNLSQNSG